MSLSLLLIPGIYNTAGVFARMEKYFVSSGFDVHLLDIVPNDGSLSLEKTAEQVRAYLNKFPEKKFIIVGFSMGGIIGRYYVQKVDQGKQVRKLVTLGSPHRGTLWAFLSDKLGIKDMRPNSTFLNALNKNLNIFDTVPFLSLWTPLDTMIVPSSSSLLKGLGQQRVWTFTHLRLVLSKRIFKLIEKFIAVS